MLRFGEYVSDRYKKGGKEVDLEGKEKSGGSGYKNPGKFQECNSKMYQIMQRINELIAKIIFSLKSIRRTLVIFFWSSFRSGVRG